MFKFPGNDRGNELIFYPEFKMVSVTFSCTVSIFLQAGETAPDPNTACEQTDVRRKRENSGKAEQQVALSKTIEVKGKCLKSRNIIFQIWFKIELFRETFDNIGKEAKPRVTKGVTVKLENNEKSSAFQFSFSFAVFAVILLMIF